MLQYKHDENLKGPMKQTQKIQNEELNYNFTPQDKTERLRGGKVIQNKIQSVING